MEVHRFTCGFCNQRFFHLRDIQVHLRNLHYEECNECQRCGIDNCQATYRNPQSLRSHISRVHRREIINDEIMPVIQDEENGQEIPVYIPAQLNEDVLSEEEQEEVDDEEVDFENSSSDDTDEDSTDNEEDEAENNNAGINDERKHTLGRFLLNLRGNTNISESQISGILTNLQDAVKTYVNKSLHRVEQILEEQRINLQDYIDINNKTELIDCIFDLNNKEKRMEYLKSEFDVLMPIRHTLGRRIVKCGSAATEKKRSVKRKKDEMMLIPLTKTIQKFAANESFHDLLKYNGSQEGVYAFVEDGSRYKNENWWKNEDESFHIKLYSDEVDMCKGLGSKLSGQQKLLMIHCSLTELNPIYQSQLLYHFLVGIVRSEDVKRYGVNRTFTEKFT